MTPEPAQPAESPEARALLPCPFCGGPAVNVAGEYITCGSPVFMDCAGRGVRADAQDWNTRAASTARPTERGAVDKRREINTILSGLLQKLQPQCPDLSERIKEGNKACTEIIAEFTPPVTVAATDSRITKDWCLNMARLEAGQEIGAGMPDHPLRAPEVAATDQAGEVERLWRALVAVKQAARYVASGDGAYDPYASHVEAVDAIVDAALATQPATGRTMGGEDGLRAALTLAHDTLHECTAVLTADDCSKVAAVMARVRAALQNGGE